VRLCKRAGAVAGSLQEPPPLHHYYFLIFNFSDEEKKQSTRITLTLTLDNAQQLLVDPE
jgi:hypothetical protein